MSKLISLLYIISTIAHIYKIYRGRGGEIGNTLIIHENMIIQSITHRISSYWELINSIEQLLLITCIGIYHMEMITILTRVMRALNVAVQENNITFNGDR